MLGLVFPSSPPESAKPLCMRLIICDNSMVASSHYDGSSGTLCGMASE